MQRDEGSGFGGAILLWRFALRTAKIRWITTLRKRETWVSRAGCQQNLTRYRLSPCLSAKFFSFSSSFVTDSCLEYTYISLNGRFPRHPERPRRTRPAVGQREGGRVGKTTMEMESDNVTMINKDRQYSLIQWTSK
jgi:hypothetical protein